MARAAIAEAIGTFVLVLTIVTTVIAAGLSKSIAGPPYGSLAIPVAGGVSLALVVASLGHVSGAHLNPAVTLGLAVNRRFPWTYVPVYLAAQFSGAVGCLFSHRAKRHVRRPDHTGWNQSGNETVLLASVPDRECCSSKVACPTTAVSSTGHRNGIGERL
jgi:glycerol uptake facilitator-like aquaporin